jgi:DNA-binding transcriptional MerR regulator
MSGPPQPSEQRVSIAEVSRLLAVPMPTLRSWELRYGIPQTARSAGKHRRYSASELHAVRLMRDQVARGLQASAAAQAVRELLSSNEPAAAFIQAFLQASRQADPVAMQAQLDNCAHSLGLGSCLDDVLLPAMQQVGRWWQTGRCDVEQEHLTTETARAWLARMTTFAPAPAPGRMHPIVLACGPTDLHTLSLEALGVLLRHRGWNCRLLGARTSVLTLSTAVRANLAAGVVLVSHLSSGRQRAVESLRAVHSLGTEVFYAGNAWCSARSRRNLPGHYLGIHLQDACALIDSTLAADRHRCA